MGLFPDCRKSHGLGGAAISPAHGQSNYCQPQVEFFQVGDAGIFDVEAAGFGVAKHALNGPSPAILA